MEGAGSELGLLGWLVLRYTHRLSWHKSVVTGGDFKYLVLVCYLLLGKDAAVSLAAGPR